MFRLAYSVLILVAASVALAWGQPATSSGGAPDGPACERELAAAKEFATQAVALRDQMERALAEARATVTTLRAQLDESKKKAPAK